MEVGVVEVSRQRHLFVFHLSKQPFLGLLERLVNPHALSIKMSSLVYALHLYDIANVKKGQD